jgi:hypothetical protein
MTQHSHVVGPAPGRARRSVALVVGEVLCPSALGAYGRAAADVTDLAH